MLLRSPIRTAKTSPTLNVRRHFCIVLKLSKQISKPTFIFTNAVLAHEIYSNITRINFFLLLVCDNNTSRGNSSLSVTFFVKFSKRIIGNINGSIFSFIWRTKTNCCVKKRQNYCVKKHHKKYNYDIMENKYMIKHYFTLVYVHVHQGFTWGKDS